MAEPKSFPALEWLLRPGRWCKNEFAMVEQAERELKAARELQAASTALTDAWMPLLAHGYDTLKAAHERCRAAIAACQPGKELEK
jgi:hypothetical protein